MYFTFGNREEFERSCEVYGFQVEAIQGRDVLVAKSGEDFVGYWSDGVKLGCLAPEGEGIQEMWEWWEAEVYCW